MIKSANILATYKNKVLVQKRDFSKNIKYKGYYCLFGGHLHKNESFFLAALKSRRITCPLSSVCSVGTNFVSCGIEMFLL